MRSQNLLAVLGSSVVIAGVTVFGVFAVLTVLGINPQHNQTALIVDSVDLLAAAERNLSLLEARSYVWLSSDSNKVAHLIAIVAFILNLSALTSWLVVNFLCQFIIIALTINLHSYPCSKKFQFRVNLLVIFLLIFPLYWLSQPSKEVIFGAGLFLVFSSVIEILYLARISILFLYFKIILGMIFLFFTRPYISWIITPIIVFGGILFSIRHVRSANANSVYWVKLTSVFILVLIVPLLLQRESSESATLCEGESYGCSRLLIAQEIVGEALKEEESSPKVTSSPCLISGFPQVENLMERVLAIRTNFIVESRDSTNDRKRERQLKDCIDVASQLAVSFWNVISNQFLIKHNNSVVDFIASSYFLVEIIIFVFFLSVRGSIFTWIFPILFFGSLAFYDFLITNIFSYMRYVFYFKGVILFLFLYSMLAEQSRNMDYWRQSKSD